jgi:hypothetical protein
MMAHIGSLISQVDANQAKIETIRSWWP